jgi:putative transposase
VPHFPSALNRLLEPFDGREMRRIVAHHDGDHGVGSGPRSWTCIRHLKALLFAQFSGLSSLRELCDGMAAQPGALYHLGLRLPRRSTLCDALGQRPQSDFLAAVFRDICAGLLGQAQRTVRRDGASLIQLLDASPIMIRDPRSAWAEADPHTRGLKLHIGFDPRNSLLDWVDVTSPKVSDVKAARDIAIASGATYVYDKPVLSEVEGGYLDFGWWQSIHAAGAFFVSRLKTNTMRRDVVASQGQLEAGILADNHLRIGHKPVLSFAEGAPRGKARNALYDTDLREVRVAREGKAPLVLITNDLTRPASEVAALYKERWQIELLFKWIKQNLKIKRFLGRNENAVKTQIYVALIAFILLRLFRNAIAPTANPKALLTRPKTALFAPFSLRNQTKPPPHRPQKHHSSQQLEMAIP